MATGRAPIVKTSRNMPPTPVAAPWYGSIKDGWLWLSILNTTASPSPISTTPAFSPGPQITRGPAVGNVFSHTFDDLYEQCSLHIAEKTPSSVRFGVRPRIATARSNSSPLSPISAASSAVTLLPLWGPPPPPARPATRPPAPPRTPGRRWPPAAGPGGFRGGGSNPETGGAP